VDNRGFTAAWSPQSPGIGSHSGLAATVGRMAHGMRETGAALGAFVASSDWPETRGHAFYTGLNCPAPVESGIPVW
jgi:hypothetical protein